MKKFINEIKHFNKSIFNIMTSGIKFCFIFCLFATLFLAMYENIFAPTLFCIGIKLFQAGLFFMAAFIIMRIYF